MQQNAKDELRHIISGKSEVRNGTIIQSAASYLKNGAGASSSIEDKKQVKKQEEERLSSFISENNLWVNDIDFTQYVSEGAEQKVYLKDGEYVLKLNDAIYYESWTDYLHNLLLHNFFFPDTAYELIGFTRKDGILYAIVKQNFVKITTGTDLANVKKFMIANGFSNTRNHDYYHPHLGVILEDLHDENVLNQEGILYFIDTVFYLTDAFWD